MKMHLPSTVRRYLPRSKFGRNILMLASGTAVAQAINIAASPLLTRIYSPEDFGAWAVFCSVISILLVLVSLRYEFAIPLPKAIEKAASLLVLSLGIVFGFCSVVAVAVWCFGGFFVKLVNVPSLGPYLWLIPLGLFGAGVFQVLNYWAVRDNDFAIISRTRVSRSLWQVAVQLILGLLKKGPLGLLLGYAVGQAGGGEVLLLAIWRKYKEYIKSVSFGSIRRVAVRYRRFPLLSSGASLLNILSSQGATLILTIFYGPQMVGQLALVNKVVGTPLTLVGSAVTQVYMGEASLILKNGGNLCHLFSKTVRKLFVWGSLPIAVLGLSGPWFFPLFFGGRWRDAGLYALILAPVFIAQFVVSSVSQSANVAERQDLQLLGDAVRLVLVLGGIVIAHILGWSGMSVIGLYSITMFVSYLFYFCLYRFVAKISLDVKARA